MVIFFFKQKTAYEMRISDWSSDVCSSDLCGPPMACRSTSLSSPIAPNSVKSSSGCVTDGCGRTSATFRPSTTPSPPSLRPSGPRGKRSFAFDRDDSPNPSQSCRMEGDGGDLPGNLLFPHINTSLPQNKQTVHVAPP